MGTPTAKDLGELLPAWTRSYALEGEPPGPAEYRRLKAVALALARAPEQERRNVIDAYGWAYCGMRFADTRRASAMFLLLRVLFAVPEGNPWWGLHAEAGSQVLRVGPCCGNQRFDQPWWPLVTYDFFAKRFHRRSPAEIEALEIR